MTAPSADRRAVWRALSELFLDTDVARLEDGIVRALAASPYDIRELERILLREVYPVCEINLRAVAGEWAGFDADWLEREITRPHSVLRRLRAATLGRLWVRWSPEWRRIKRRLRERRKGA